MIARLKAAWAAFRYAGQKPSFAVIYDSNEYPNQDDPIESYYEVFMSPAEAYEIFNQAYPFHERAQGVTEPGTERLVMILGPIDRYKKEKTA
jgi:hypothetical protein